MSPLMDGRGLLPALCPPPITAPAPGGSGFGPDVVVAPCPATPFPDVPGLDDGGPLLPPPNRPPMKRPTDFPAFANAFPMAFRSRLKFTQFLLVSPGIGIGPPPPPPRP